MQEIAKERRRRSIRRKTVGALCCAAVFCVTYALILPSAAMTGDIYCGLEEHQHGQECFENRLICDYEGLKMLAYEASEGETAGEAHVHTESCYEQVLTCPLEEHIHSLACYSDPKADLETAPDWERTVEGVKLTGSYGADLLEIARTQLGYTESTSNYIVSKDGETLKGYTRYGAWYGDSYGDWCAMYISFCLNYADIPEDDFPREASCQSWLELLRSEEWNLYHASREGYTPNPGDLVFFDWDRDGEADHVGIVAALSTEEAGSLSEAERERALDEAIRALIAGGADEMTAGSEGADTGDAVDPAADSTENTILESSADEAAAEGAITLLTVEGDSGNKVQTRAYSLDDTSILGYGRLPESEYEHLYTSMKEIFLEVRAFADADESEDLQGLCLDAYLRLCDLLDPAYDACGEGRLTKEQLSNLEALFDEIVTYMQDAYGFDPYGISAAANVEGVDWGYNEDGSIWWTGYNSTTVIEINKPYAITSKTSKYYMTTEVNSPGLTGKTGISEDALIWYFEETDMVDTYYIYTTVDGYKKYLKMTSSSNTDGKLELVDESNKDAFKASFQDGNVFLYSDQAGKYINAYGGEGGFQKFAGWNKNDAGSMLCLCDGLRATSKPVETVSPSSTIINLFDYWTTSRFVDDTNDNNNAGINKDRAFKFNTVSNGDGTKMNVGTGSAVLTQGIVANTLGEDGYPVLSGTEIADNSTESLNYLFDTSIESDGKYSYRDVQGLLQVNSEGYFYYDSRYNMVEFPIDESGNSTNRNSFIVYDKPGVYPNVSSNPYGEFFPFNKAPQVVLLNANNKNNDAGNKILNHYFGMTVTTRFIQEHGGYTDADQKTATSFHFSGDDDVWIFIDGVLVADLGGKHTRVGVTIDFSKGTVTYDNGVSPTTLKTAFETALKADDPKLDASKWNGNTFANNTTHTLKFYYLERGNFDSNLDLKFNLTEIPPTSIYKVDQYGDALEGAVFAVYPAVKEYDKDDSGNDLTTFKYLYKLDAGSTAEWDGSWYIDTENGNVYDASGNLIITAGYHGKTDENGSMMFADEDGMPFTESELKEKLTGSETGEYFILREVSIPSGYRTVSAETWLYFSGSNMICDNTYQSGVWASPNAMVVSTNTLYVADAYKDSSIGTDNGIGKAVAYYDPETGKTTGTLFAVVLKRNGAELANVDSWYPLYGSDIEGYTVMDTSGIESVIAAAQAQADPANNYGGSSVFQYSASGMKVTLENLPGKITRYYTYIQNQKDPTKLLKDLPNADNYIYGEDPQYFVAYYYTTEDSVYKATASNTVRVISRQGVLTEADGSSAYDGFSIQWGTTIEVPNMENRLFFQKTNGEQNEDGTPVLLDGAVFALYEAYAADSTKEQTTYVYYVGRDGSGNTVYVGILDSDGGEGYDGHAVVFSGEPELLGYGIYKIDRDGLSDETINKTTGEISNPSPTLGRITVTITDDSRNNAATGTTYTVDPVKNAKDETLVGATHDTCEYVSEAGTGHFTNLADGKYYLREIYAPDGYDLNNTDIPVLVNNNGVYAYAGDAGEEDNGVTVGNGTGYLTQTLDVFASPGEIDETLTWVYAVLLQNNTKGFAEFEKVSGDVIKVTKDNTWHFVGKGTETRPGYGDELINVSDDTALTSEQARNSAMKTYMVYDGKLATQKSKELIFDYVPNANHEGGEGQIRLFTDEGWSDLAIYQDYDYGSENRTNPTGTAYSTYYEDLSALGNISNLFSSSTFVRVTDEKLIKTADLQIKKVDMVSESTPLSGARFRLYRVETDPCEDGTITVTRGYYSKAEDGVAWVADADDATTVTTDSNGFAAFTGLYEGTYYIEEISAPDGYRLLSETVKVEIEDTVSDTGAALLSHADASGGIRPAETKIVTAKDGAETDTVKWLGTKQESSIYLYTLIVPNSTGFELPATGGGGAVRYYISGLLLMAAGSLGREKARRAKKKR